MTDYLEWIGENADVLLEEQNRLERMRLSVYRGQESGEEVKEDAAASLPSSNEEMPLLASLRRAEGEHRQVETLRRNLTEESAVGPFRRENRTEESVRMRGEGFAGVSPFRERELSGDGGWLLREMEQTFRRDSRRYDSGFYLY